MRELRVLACEPRQHLGHTRLAHEQVVVVRPLRILLLRHRDAHPQPRDHQLVQHRQLVDGERRHLVVAADHVDHGARRIGTALHRVRARDREPAHARRVDDVAEIDQPRHHAVRPDEDVVLVGVVVDDLVGEVVERALVPVLQVPAVRAVHLRVREVRERAVHPRHRRAQRRAVTGCERPRLALQPAQQPHRVPVQRLRRPREPRHGRLPAQVLQHRVLEREVGRARVQLEHVPRAVRGQREVEVQLARERRGGGVEPVQLTGDQQRVGHRGHRAYP